MDPRIEEVSEKKLIGNRLVMCLSEDRTKELWQGFMSRRKEIGNAINTGLISMQVYERLLSFSEFNDTTQFEKWAVVEVKDYKVLPKGVESYTLFGGLYAVFIHKGLPSAFPKTAQYIYGVWLPHSDYELDHREHFEVLGDRYRKNDDSSEEEVWVPIKNKKLK
ncbi:AraC family transcriptional regulator [Arenibacter sp. TNZ]|nr:AraC family transcriptional regulator [Arenibacter sp. TNZ]